MKITQVNKQNTAALRQSAETLADVSFDELTNSDGGMANKFITLTLFV